MYQHVDLGTVRETSSRTYYLRFDNVTFTEPDIVAQQPGFKSGGLQFTPFMGCSG